MIKKIKENLQVEQTLSQSLIGFIDFIRAQGVVGLSVGFILGGSVSKVVNSLVKDIVDPILGLVLGSVSGLQGAYLPFFGSKIMYGNFLSVLLDFVVIAATCYFLVHSLGLDRMDKKK
jgi:large conductance mechanosensitive channel